MILLSSFPRSGNTFLRNILFEVYGMESSEFYLDTTHPLADDFMTYPVVKTHELPSCLSNFDSDITTVYLVRDGRIRWQHESRHIADRPDYKVLARYLRTALGGSG